MSTFSIESHSLNRSPLQKQVQVGAGVVALALPIPLPLRAPKPPRSDGETPARSTTRTQSSRPHPEARRESRTCPASSRRHSGFVVTQDLIGAELRHDWPFGAAQPDCIELVGQGTSRTSPAETVVPLRHCGPDSLG